MRRFLFAAGALVLAMIVAESAVQAQCSPFGRSGGLFRHKVRYLAPPACGFAGYQATCAPVASVVPTGQVSTGQAVQQAGGSPAPGPAASGGDAAGFLAWLNSTRAAYGLPAVGYSAEVEASCRQNNILQAARGMNHWFMGCHRRQNAAWGLGFPGVESAWMGSPGHCSALLDPTIRWIGIAWLNGYCTFGGS